MTDSRSKNVSRNIIYAFANKFVAFVLPFVARTIILYLLGEDYLGIGSLFTSVLSFLSLAELGLGSAIVYSMYKPIAENDTDKICALLSYYRDLYRKIGMAILLIGTILVPAIPYLIKGDPPQGVNVYILFYIYLINTVISYFFAGYKQSLVTAHQRSDIVSKISLFVNVVIQVGQILVLVCTRNFYAYACVPVVGTVLTNIFNQVVTNKRYPQLQCRGKLDEESREGIRKRLSGLVGTKLNSVVVHSADTLVISAFLSLRDTAVYGNYYYIMNAVNAFVVLFFSSLTASVGNSLVTETQEKNLSLFYKISFINAWISGWCAVCLMCLFHPFMVLWTGEGLTYPLGVEIALVLYFFIFSIQRTMLVFKDAAGIWYEDRFRAYVCMTVNIILNLLLVRVIGIYGVVLSSVLAFSISVPWANYTLFHYLFKTGERQNLLKLLYYGLVTLVTAVLCYQITSRLPLGATKPALMGWLFVRFLICLILPNLLFALLYCRQQEFWQVIRMIRGRLERHFRRK